MVQSTLKVGLHLPSGKDDSRKDADDFQRQLRQISVLFKSAAALTSQTLT